MAFRRVDVMEIREVLWQWLSGAGLRTVAERTAGGPQDGPPVRRGGAGCRAGAGGR
jgi:hypothetical protein